jgi:hypothetical protein
VLTRQFTHDALDGQVTTFLFVQLRFTKFLRAVCALASERTRTHQPVAIRHK